MGAGHLNSNIYYGISFLHASNNTITDNITNSNSNMGIGVEFRSLNNVLTGNIVTGNSKGVRFHHYSTGNVLSRNTISNNSIGIELSRYSDNNTLTGNTIESNSCGICGYTSNNSVTGNHITSNDRGIYLYGTTNNVLTDNTMSMNGFSLAIDGWLDAHFDHSIDTSNAVNGKPVYYIMNAANQVYDSAVAGAFFLIHCQNITIADPTLAMNRIQVFLWDTHYSTLENLTTSGISLSNSSNNLLTGNTANSGLFGFVLNNATDNTLVGNTANMNRSFGILINFSDGNTLSDNIANSNHSGIRIERSSGGTLTGNTTDSNTGLGFQFVLSDGNVVAGNTVSNNGDYGVWLYSSNNNQIYNNDFLNNLQQARVSDSIGNVFNLAEPIGGNYWSDWSCPDADGDGIVDLPYVFYGGQDNLPLVPDGGCLNDSPVADAGPDQVLLIGNTATFDGSASYDPDGNIVSDEWNFGDGTPAQFGTVVSHDYAATGIYSVTLTVTDDGGITDEDMAVVEVITPAQAIENLVATIEDMNLQQGIENNLDAKLDAAQQAILDLNANNDVAACSTLQALVVVVEAQRGNQITEADADAIIAAVQEIMVAIGCVFEPFSCGDGTVDAVEECDDGNNTDGDGCSATCTLEVGCIPPCDEF